MTPWSGFKRLKVPLSAFQLAASVLPFVVNAWPVHTHTHTHTVLPSPACVCVQACSYITQCRLAVFGYDVQIRTVRDYIIVWKDTGLVEFSAWKGRAAAAASEAQSEFLLIRLCFLFFLLSAVLPASAFKNSESYKTLALKQTEGSACLCEFQNAPFLA